MSGSSVLNKLKTIVQLGKEKGDVPLPENTSVEATPVVELRKGLKCGKGSSDRIPPSRLPASAGRRAGLRSPTRHAPARPRGTRGLRRILDAFEVHVDRPAQPIEDAAQFGGDDLVLASLHAGHFLE